MKNLNFNSLLIIFCLTIFSPNSIQAQKKYKGNGKVTKEERNIKTFNRLYISGVFTISLTQGSEESLIVETDSNLQKLIISENKGDALVVRWKEKTSNIKAETIHLHITVKELEKVKLNGVGELQCTNTLNSKDLKLEITGVGENIFDISTKNLKVDSAIIGSLKLIGFAESAEIKHTGIGSIEAKKLTTLNMDINVTGIGGAEINVENKLKARATGIGSINYYGNPTIKEIKASGLGSIDSIH